jgi:hypothetical protein
MNESRRYEFDLSQNEIFRNLSRSMEIVGAFLVTLGVLYVVAFVLAISEAVKEPADWGKVAAIGIAMLLALTVGVWTRKAGRAFGDIPQSSGNDIEHLMDAIANLRKMYAILSGVVMVFVVLFVLSLIVSWAR